MASYPITGVLPGTEAVVVCENGDEFSGIVKFGGTKAVSLEQEDGDFIAIPWERILYVRSKRYESKATSFGGND